MKSLIISLFVAALTLPLGATNVGSGAIEQPLNLGSHADPARIPLVEVGWDANYNYNIHRVITEPCPLIYGLHVTPVGPELNANLASAFGIFVEPEDSTDVPNKPVTLRIKTWPKPAYSPYTCEQVLAATIHCLLRSVRAKPRCPLKLRIIAEDPQESRRLQKFAGDYVTAPDDSREPVVPVTPTPVPGCRVEIGRDLLPTVVFDKPPPRKTPPRTAPPLRLGFVPCHLGEESMGFSLLPVPAGETWTGQLIDIITLPAPLNYDCFNPHQGGDEANALIVREIIGPYPRAGERTGFAWVDPDVELSNRLPIPESDTGLIAAMCYAYVLTYKPTVDHPLHIRLSQSIKAFAAHPEWKPVTDRTDLRAGNYIECAFVWDPEKMRVSRGGTPGHHLERTKLGTWRVVPDPDAPAADAPLPDPTDQSNKETIEPK